MAQERAHARFCIEHGCIHADIQHPGSLSYLPAGDGQGLLPLLFFDQAGEFARSCNVRTFTDHQQVVGFYLYRIKTAQHQRSGGFVPASGNCLVAGPGQGGYMRRGGATTSAKDVESALLQNPCKLVCHRIGSKGVDTLLVGKPCVGMGADIERTDCIKLLDEGEHLFGACRAVQPQAEKGKRTEAGYKGLKRLAAERSPALVAEGDADHDRDGFALLGHGIEAGKDGTLGSKRIKYGFNQKQIHASLNQGPRLLSIHRKEIRKITLPVGGVFHLRGEGKGSVGRPEDPGNEGVTIICGLEIGSRFTRNFTGSLVDGLHLVLQAILSQIEGIGAEGIGLDNVGTCLEVLPMNRIYDITTGEIDHLVASIGGKILKRIVFDGQALALDHGSHRPVKQYNTLREQSFQVFRSVHCSISLQRLWILGSMV